MAKESLLTHRKFRRLCNLLRLNPAHVLGHLEMLFLSAHMAGSPTFANAPLLEAAAFWEGKAGGLAAAMREAGFLDKGKGHALALHDYWDHAPEYVRKRLARATDALTAERRTTADNGGQRRPTDPIPIPDRPDLHTDQRSDPRLRKDRDRPANVIQLGEGSTPKGAKGAPQSLGELIPGVNLTPSTPPKPRSMTRDSLDLGTATANELAIWASRWEKAHDTTTARKLWKSRLAALDATPGGLEFFRKLCSVLRHNRAQVPDGRKDRIQHPSRYLNSESLKWLKAHNQEAS